MLEGSKKNTYKGTLNLNVVGTGVTGYTTSLVSNEILYTLTYSQKRLDGAYFAFYEVDATSGDASILGKGAYRTNGTTMTVSNMPLSVGDDGYAATIVCETKAPDGYDVFDGTKVRFDGGSIYTSNKYGFNIANADENNVITRNVTLENKAKSFSVSITKKDQTGTALSGYNFGLYTTQEITVSGKTAITAGSLVAYATTGSNGVATFDAYLPVSQNYVLKEVGCDNKEYDIIVKENTIHASKIELDVLNKATVDGYEFTVMFQER